MGLRYYTAYKVWGCFVVCVVCMLCTMHVTQSWCHSGRSSHLSRSLTLQSVFPNGNGPLPWL
jgi:hypothetical protein